MVIDWRNNMKLGHKIFLSILFVSIFVYCISSYLLITSSHNNNIERELRHSENEFEIIINSIENSIDQESNRSEYEEYIERNVERFSEFYGSKAIYLIYGADGKVIFDGVKKVAGDKEEIDYKELLQVKEGSYKATIKKTHNNHYIMLSNVFLENKQLIYVRDISYIYKIKMHMTVIALGIGLALVIVLGFVSNFIAQYITKPLTRLANGVEQIAMGNLEIQLKEGIDEIGILSTRFNHMAEAVKSREQQLQENIEARQTFIDNMSHEMNTPLAVLQGYAEILQNGNIPKESKQIALENIQKETKRIRNMYHKLRVLSLLGVDEIEKQEVDLIALFMELKEELAFLTNKNRVRLELWLYGKEILNQENMVFYIHGDKTFLYILFSNLVRNGINYSKQGGLVKIDCALDGNEKKAVIEIKDDGIGITKENLEHIFEPFYRVDKSRSRKTGGSGLGLSICKKIIELHNGKITVDSQLGEGTTMTVTLSK